MTRIERTFVVVIALALLVGAATLPATPQQTQPAPEPMKVEGELLRVDTDTQTIAIKTEAAAELEFRYTDTTEVTGAGEGVAGLATMNGSRVTVHYVQKEGGTRRSGSRCSRPGERCRPRALATWRGRAPTMHGREPTS